MLTPSDGTIRRARYHERMEHEGRASWAEVQFRCTSCNGEGRIHTNPPGIPFDPGLHDNRCIPCNGKGRVTRCLDPDQFKKWLAGEDVPY